MTAGHTLEELPIDHGVAPTRVRGGSSAGKARLDAFVRDDLKAYGDHRNEPDHDVSSRLSPYLHWGHLGPHEVFDRLMANEGWLGHLPARATGMREGWWGVSPAADAFLDEFVTWRELGYNIAENPVTIPDFHATVLHLLGIDHTRLTYYHNGIQRRLTDVHGEVVPGVLA